MAKPTDDVSWATSANYPAGPETYAATPTTVEPLSGRKAEGWEPGKKPPAQGMNWWQRGVWRWIAWLAQWFTDTGHLIELDNIVDSSYNLLENLVPITQHEFPMPFWVSNFRVDDELTSADGHGNPALRNITGSAGAAFVKLTIPEGHRLTSLTVKAASDGSHSLALTPSAFPIAAGQWVPLGTKAVTSATPADVTVSCYGHTDGVSVTVGGSVGGYTFTRTVGSWITDGFEIGQNVSITGMPHSANNLTSQPITSLSATVMTITDGGLGTPFVETSSAGVFATPSSMTDSTQHVGLLVNATGGTIGIRNLRYTHVRIP